MTKYFLIGLITYLCFTVFKFLLVLLVSKYYKEDSGDNRDFSFSIFFLESIIYASIFSGFGMISSIESKNEALTILLSIFLIALIPTYAFVIAPFRYLLAKKKYTQDTNINKLFPTEKFRCKIRIIDAKVINAYATGVLPFSRTILIGRPLIHSLSESELKSIIYHEIGHLKKKHLNKLYIVTILVSTFSYFIFSFRGTFQFGNETLNILSIGLAGAMMGFLIWIIPGKVQYQFEYEADLFSARENGKERLIEALKKLDTLSNGEVSKGGITHPSLQKRIQNLNNKVLP